MKTRILLFAFSLLTVLTVTAQKKRPRHGNLFDTTYARRHELSISMGPTMGSAFNSFGDNNGPKGPTFALEYARVYKFNHFLRTGLRYADRGDLVRSRHSLPASPAEFDNQPDNYSIDRYTWRNDRNNSYASAFVGYEYGVGVRKFRFTFGVDMNIGYQYRMQQMREDHSLETRTLNPVTNLYQYTVDYLQTGRITSKSHLVFVSLSPRFGIRRELGRRVALALTFSPQVGYSYRFSHSEKVTDTRPTRFHDPKSSWFMAHNAELRVIFKLGPNR